MHEVGGTRSRRTGAARSVIPAGRGSARRRGGGARPAIVAAAVALSATLAGCAGTPLGPPSPVTRQGREIGSLWSVFVWVALAIGALVWGLIGYAVVRYRRRGREGLPPQFRYHLPLEITYTGIPVVIVIVLFVLTAGVITRVNALTPDPDLVVEVTGFQWDWKFVYPNQGITVLGEPGSDPVLVLPTDRVIRLELTSADVVHSLYVPEFMEKRDLIPGSVEQVDIELTEQGTYQGRCAEFCGTYHDSMVFDVEAVPPAEFAAWVEAQGGGGS